MAGTPTNLASSMVTLGRCHIWVDVELPASGDQPTLTALSDGTLTPDATTSPNALNIGYTQEGAKLLYKPETQEFIPDESNSAIISALVGEPSNIQGTWWQLLDMDVMEKMMVGGSRFTASGVDGLTWGGNQNITTFTALVIGPVYDDPTKIFAIMLYACYNKAGFDFSLSKRQVAASPFDFQAQEISSRPKGDRIGQIYKTT